MTDPSPSDILDATVNALDVSFASQSSPAESYALGYSGDQDPSFRYCYQPMTFDSYYGYVLDGCELSGGSSGGPWSDDLSSSDWRGSIISVNSYGDRRNTYMGGPYLSDNSARCLFEMAKSVNIADASVGGGIIGTVNGDNCATATWVNGNGGPVSPSPTPPITTTTSSTTAVATSPVTTESPPITTTLPPPPPVTTTTLPPPPTCNAGREYSCSPDCCNGCCKYRGRGPKRACCP